MPLSPEPRVARRAAVLGGGALAIGALYAGASALGDPRGLTTALLLSLFVHVHDAVHRPGLSPLERFGWFCFLDRHHFVHHVDTNANTNVLLPLGDRLFGTLRRELNAEELERWPSYEEAQRRVLRPSIRGDGRKQRGGEALSWPVSRQAP